MATHHLQRKKHATSTQQLNIYFPLKDSRSLSFSKFTSESLNPSRRFLKCFIIFTSYPYSLLHFFLILIPSILEFWCLATVTFKFAVLYNNIEKKLSLLLVSKFILLSSLLWLWSLLLLLVSNFFYCHHCDDYYQYCCY